MQTRIFELLESVAKFGPITLDELSRKTGISRSATFRGLKRLEDGGWIRMRLNGRQYVLSSMVEQRLNSKVEPKKEIESLTPFIRENVDLKTIRTRVFQQETTTKAELVDDSVFKSSETADETMAIECCNFLLQILQHADFAVGKPKLNEAQLAKADTILQKLETKNFVIVQEQRFLWLPIFSMTSDVFLLCLSCRNFGRIDCALGHEMIIKLRLHETSTGLITFKDFKESSHYRNHVTQCRS